MTQEFEGGDSHISIAMPEGTTCRAYIPFQVYSSDDGGEIVRLDYKDIIELSFNHDNMLDKYHKSLEVWCSDNLKSLKQNNLDSLEAQLESSPQRVSPLLHVTGNIKFEHPLAVGEMTTTQVSHNYIMTSGIFTVCVAALAIVK